jgi:threonyl-tRNA synthetase
MRTVTVCALQTAGEKLGKSIRNAELEKIPVVCIVGQRDIDTGAVSVRTYAEGEVGQLSADEVVSRLLEASAQRTGFRTDAAA